MKKGRTVVYPAVFDDSENEQGEYTISFPDVPSAISQADSIEEALDNAREVLGLALFDAEKLPDPSDIHIVQKAYPNAIVTLISEDLDYAATTIRPALVKKNTTLPANLAARAEKEGINFSQVLAEALKEKLGV